MVYLFIIRFSIGKYLKKIDFDIDKLTVFCVPYFLNPPLHRRRSTISPMTMLTGCLLLCLPALLQSVCAELNKDLKLVDYYKGSPGSNVVMTAPHDGWIKVDEIPIRQKVRLIIKPFKVVVV